MVLDTSVVLAILFDEPEAEAIEAAIERAPVRLMAATSLLEAAIVAEAHYGKGRHPAALNFGDCFSYALSRASGESLLFTGGDFSRTDVVAAMSPDEE